MQLQLFTNISEGRTLAQQGMQRAVDHADQYAPYNWSEKAYAFLLAWLSTMPYGCSFQTEDIRTRAEKVKAVPPAPSKRAWGAIILKAKRQGLIINNGTAPVKNKTAHCANAAVWVKL